LHIYVAHLRRKCGGPEALLHVELDYPAAGRQKSPLRQWWNTLFGRVLGYTGVANFA
jgi:hypothetical protein